MVQERETESETETKRYRDRATETAKEGGKMRERGRKKEREEEGGGGGTWIIDSPTFDCILSTCQRERESCLIEFDEHWAGMEPLLLAHYS